MLGTFSEQQTARLPSPSPVQRSASISPEKRSRHVKSLERASLDKKTVWPASEHEARCVLSFVEALQAHSIDASTLDLSSEHKSPRSSPAESLEAAFSIYDQLASTTTLSDSLKDHIETLAFESTSKDVDEYRAALLTRFPSLRDLLPSEKEMTVTYTTAPPVTPYTASVRDVKTSSKDRFNAILSESYAPAQQENVPPPNEVTSEASTRFESAFPLDFHDVSFPYTALSTLYSLFEQIDNASSRPSSPVTIDLVPQYQRSRPSSRFASLERPSFEQEEEEDDDDDDEEEEEDLERGLRRRHVSKTEETSSIVPSDTSAEGSRYNSRTVSCLSPLTTRLTN